MDENSYGQQLKTILFLDLCIFGVIGLMVYWFWDFTCQDNGILSCLRDDTISVSHFLFLSFFRPFLFTPLIVFTMMAGHQFGLWWATFLSAFGAIFSTFIVFAISKYFGRKYIFPWLSGHLPETLRFLRSQDFKIIFAIRMIPFFPFDVATILFGLLDFRFSYMLLFTFLGILPECYIFASMESPNMNFVSGSLTTLTELAALLMIPALAFELYERQKGTGMLPRLGAMWTELKDEVQVNNAIIKRRQYDPNKIPILLIYGFFSSRRTMTILERLLVARGFDVVSFNMGGLLGIFFTKSVIEAAAFVDYKLKRQMERFNFDKVHIVAHSKGGLVALWWALKFNGYKHCDKIITMGTPYKGTWLAWLALLSPLGYVIRDVWQMRPGSQFLKDLHNVELPPNLQIYNLYSESDKVSPNGSGMFEPVQGAKQITYVPLHHATHFDFLKRKDVADLIMKILKTPYKPEFEKINRQAAMGLKTPTPQTTNQE